MSLNMSYNLSLPRSLLFLFIVLLSEVLQVLRGAGKVGSALVSTQGEQLRFVVSNSTVGAGVRVAQEAVEGLMASFGGGGKAVRIPAWSVNPSLQGCGELV